MSTSVEKRPCPTVDEVDDRPHKVQNCSKVVRQYDRQHPDMIWSMSGASIPWPFDPSPLSGFPRWDHQTPLPAFGPAGNDGLCGNRKYPNKGRILMEKWGLSDPVFCHQYDWHYGHEDERTPKAREWLQWVHSFSKEFDHLDRLDRRDFLEVVWNLMWREPFLQEQPHLGLLMPYKRKESK